MRAEMYTRLTTDHGDDLTLQLDSTESTLHISSDRPKSTHAPSEVRYIRLLLCFLLGVLIFVCPVPHDLAEKENGELGWHLLAIFIFTLAVSVSEAAPLPIAGIMGLSLCALTNTLGKNQIFLGFGNSVIWFIFAALTVGKCVEVSCLSNRIACLLISKLGFSTLGLGYAVTLTDLVMAPAMPSNTARTGVLLPINSQICKMFGGTSNEVGDNIGAYLQLVHFASVQISSATFLTAMAGSPLLIDFMQKTKPPVDIHWGVWFLCALLPCFLSTIINPILLLKLSPPRVRKSEHVQALAIEQLSAMGSVFHSKDERIVLAVMICMLIMWVLGPGITPLFEPTVVAWYGCTALAFFGVLKVEHVVQNYACWLLVIWFPIVLNMADHLVKFSVFGWISGNLESAFEGVDWPVVYVCIVLVYILTQFGFASLTSHLTALFPVMLQLLLTAGAPPVLAALMLCYCSSLSGFTSHYVSVSPMLFAMGYTSPRKWLLIGNTLLFINLIIWLGIGTGWIYLIGFTR